MTAAERNELRELAAMADEIAEWVIGSKQRRKARELARRLRALLDDTERTC